MKEIDVRERVRAFLRVAAVPVGVVLAGGGCVYSSPEPADGGKADAPEADAAGEAAMHYAAPMPDACCPIYSAPTPTPDLDEAPLRSR